MEIIKINDWMFIIGVLLVINIVMTWFVMGKLNYLLSYVPYNQGLAMDTQSEEMDIIRTNEVGPGQERHRYICKVI